MVPRKGLEPSQPCGHRYLKPARLPFRHQGINHQGACLAQYYRKVKQGAGLRKARQMGKYC